MPHRPPAPCTYPGCPVLVDASRKCEQHRGKVTIVCGLPGSGKSTYVESARRRGDLVWDLDILLAALTGLPMREKPEDCVGLMIALRDAFVCAVAYDPPERAVWIIVTAEDLARQMAGRLTAKIIEVEVAEDERQARLEERYG